MEHVHQNVKVPFLLVHRRWCRSPIGSNYSRLLQLRVPLLPGCFHLICIFYFPNDKLSLLLYQMELQTLFEMEDNSVSEFEYHVVSSVPDFQTKLADSDLSV